MKAKKVSTYITGHCATGMSSGHDRCGRFALPAGMTCKCICHLSQGTSDVAGSFPEGDATGDQAEATAADGDD